MDKLMIEIGSKHQQTYVIGFNRFDFAFIVIEMNIYEQYFS